MARTLGESVLEFLGELGLFLVKTIIIIGGFSIIIMLIAGLRKHGDDGKGYLSVVALHDELEERKQQILNVLLDKFSVKKLQKEKKKKKALEKKQAKKNAVSEEKAEQPPRIFIINFKGDIQASGVSKLRREISAILSVANDGDEVLVQLESSGGVVHGYGLAASQLKRIRDRNIQLTIAVDKVAASGGYMMACLGNTILAAPFAILGSIGVVAQLPNIHKLLKKNNVDVELHTAGQYKRTLTVLGENTEEGRAKFIEELQDVHELFKEFIRDVRPAVNLEEVATGEVWYGLRAQKKNLIDKIKTSDQYIQEKFAQGIELYNVSWKEKKTFAQKVGVGVEHAFNNVIKEWIGRFSNRIFP